MEPETLDQENQEELEITIQLATSKVSTAITDAITAAKEKNGDKASSAIDEALAALEGYTYGYPEPHSAKSILAEAKKAIDDEDFTNAEQLLTEAKTKAAAGAKGKEMEKPTKAPQGTIPDVQAAEQRIRLAADIKPITGPGPRGFEVTLIDPGKANGLNFSPQVLQAAVPLINDLTSFTNHERMDVFYNRPGGRTIEDICGVIHNARWVNGAVKADWRPSGAKGEFVAGMIDQIISDRDAGLPVPDVGVSLDLSAFYLANGDVTEISQIHSGDIVFNAARGPKFGQAFGRIMNSVQERLNTSKGVTHMPDEIVTTPQAAPGITDEDRAWATALRTNTMSSMLATSGLPEPSRQRLAAGIYATPEGLQVAIDAERTYLAALTENQVIQIGGVAPRSGHISGGRPPLEQVELAFHALLAGKRPEDSSIPALTGIRELYHLMSGDSEMTGMFYPERVYLANVNSSTMAGLVANAMNKIVVQTFQTYPQWWTNFVSAQDFLTLQDIRWITLGGLGELPTVAEGTVYTELAWDDKTETTSFVKKGGYLGITLETIDKDETGKIRMAPQALAQAAWLTLCKAIAGIFTTGSGYGPLMADGYRLFDATYHGNLGTNPMSWTGIVATRLAMRKQTELNSGERLGFLTAPKYYLVPADLEIVTLQALMSAGEPETNENQENPFVEGDTQMARLKSASNRIVVCDFWSDVNDWVAVADPNLYPTIGLGFRYGRQPEIFSVASPTAGLMFTNDVMPIKVRFFYAVGPMDWRGVYKNIVT